MAVRFPPAWLDELRARADIVQVVSAYVPLKKNGHRYVGLCPFHNEKTASFSVDGDKHLYHCFGCKAGGSVIQFVMEIERLDFQEAVRHLADQVNLPLPQMEEDPGYQARKNLRERLYEANRLAAQFYHKKLWEPEGKGVLRYLHERGLDDGVIRRFGLGASGANYDEVTRHLEQEGFTLSELNQAGLTVVKEKKHFDMFRKRAMFPIIDSYGKVVGFGGRAMEDVQPKYLNTSDTLVFNKRQGVYAANLLRKARNLSRVILVEGYMDVVALSQFGVEGVVATLGTALTKEQADLLKRFAPQVWVAYDGDSAGQQATLRALDVMENAGMPAKVLRFPKGLDPDEFIRQRGLEAFRALAPMTAVGYRLERLSEGFDLSTQDGRVDYAKASAEVLKKVTQPVELETYIQQLMLQTGFTREVLLAQVGTSVATAAKEPAYRPLRRSPTVDEPGMERGEQQLLAILASGKLPKDVVTSEDFDHPLAKEIYTGLGTGLSPAAIMENQPDPALQRQMSQVFAMDVSGEPDQLMRMAEESLKTLRKGRTTARIAALNQQLATAPLTAEERQALMREIIELQKLTRH